MRSRRGRLTALTLIGVLVAGTIGYAGYGAFMVGVRGYCLEDVVPLARVEERLVTGPYVQDVTPTSAALLWWSADPAPAIVGYGLAPDLTETIAVAPAARQEVTLTDLAPGTTYSYAVAIDGDEPVRGTLRTAPPPSSTVTIGVLGDSGNGSAAQDAVARLLEEFTPDVVVHTGDVVYPHGALCRYDDRFFDQYQTLLAAVPFYPAIGNHDLDADDGQAFDDVFRLPAATARERFYAFAYGPIRFVVLDSEVIQPGTGDSVLASRQVAWLEAELAANSEPSSWTVVVLHRAPYTSTAHHDGDVPVLETFVPLFAAGGVDLVLSGHVHAYERTIPLDGVTYVVTGGGGGDLFDVTAGGEIAVAASIHHAVRLTASPTELTIEAIAADGTRIDRFTLTPDP